MKRDGRKLDHRTLEEIRRMAPWINQRQLSFHLALSRMTASKILDRRLRVESVNSPSAETARSARYAAERQVIDALRTDTTHQVNDRSIASACRRVFDTNARFSQFDWRRAAPY